MTISSSRSYGIPVKVKAIIRMYPLGRKYSRIPNVLFFFCGESHEL
jgi:hypothetical protein